MWNIGKGHFIMALIALEFIAISSTAPHVPEESSSTAPGIESSAAAVEDVSSSEASAVTDDNVTPTSPSVEENRIQILIEENKRLADNVLKLESVLLAKEGPNSIEYDRHFNANNQSYDGKLAKSCSEATQRNNFQNGPYVLNMTETNLLPFYVYCIHERPKDKAWMIIQKRLDGTINFNRLKDDYELGFGDLYGEYWLGLERLHQITNVKSYELFVWLKERTGEEHSVKFKEFAVDSKIHNYKLTIGGYNKTIGDAMGKLNGMSFSTLDNDMDKDLRSCAKICRAGWWYNKCDICGPNSPLGTHNSRPSHGLNWGAGDIVQSNIKKMFMSIREKKQPKNAKPRNKKH